MDIHKKQLPEPITWALIAFWIAQGIVNKIGEEVAGQIIDKVLGREDVNYPGLFQEAITEIIKNVEKVIDDALDEEFIQQYIETCNFIKRQLVLYQQTQDEGLIKDMQLKSGEVAEHLYGKGIKAFGGLLVACNLHLLSLRALAEKKPEWRKGLLDHFALYAGWIEEMGRKYWDVMSRKVSAGCECRPIMVIDDDGDFDCDDVPPESKRWYFWYDFKVESIGYGTLNECEDAMNKIFDETVHPAALLFGDSRTMVKAYREFRIE